MSEDLRHIVEQSFAAEETQAEKTPEEIRSETYAQIDIANNLLGEIAEKHGKESEFYKKLLGEYQQAQQKIIESLPGTINHTEINIIKKEVKDVQKMVIIISLQGKILEKKRFSEFTEEEKEEFQTGFDTYASSVESPQFILDYAEQNDAFKKFFAISYVKLNDVIKNDTRIVQLLLENYENSSMKDSSLFINMLTKEFQQSDENKIFILKNAPNDSLREKILSELLAEETDIGFIEALLSQAKEIGILRSEIVGKLSEDVLQDKEFLEKYFSAQEITEVLKRRGAKKLAFQYSLRGLDTSIKLTPSSIAQINYQIKLYGTDGIENMLLDIVEKNDFGYFTALHNDRDFIAQLVSRNKDYKYLNFASTEIKNDMVFLESIAGNKEEFEKLLESIGVFITNNDTITQVQRRAEELGVNTEKLGLQFQNKDEILKVYQKQETEKAQKNLVINDLSLTEQTPKTKNFITIELGLTQDEAKTLTNEEIKNLQGPEKKEARENFRNFKDECKKYGMTKIWEKRNYIIPCIQQDIASGIDTTDDYINQNEYAKFFAQVLYSLKDSPDPRIQKEKNTIISLQGGTNQDMSKIIPILNRVNTNIAGAGIQEKSMIYPETPIEEIFNNLYVNRESGTISFKKSEFQKALAS